MSSEETWQRLLDKRREIGRLRMLKEFLKWREESGESLPERIDDEGYDSLTEIEERRRSELESDEMNKLLEQLDPRNFSEDDEFTAEEKKAIYREVKREHESVRAVDSELQREIEEIEQDLDKKWSKAEDFDEIKDDFHELVEKKRQYAEEAGYEEEPYQVFFRQYEPFFSLGKTENIFSNLQQQIIELRSKLDPDFQSDLAFAEITDDSYSEEKLVDFQRKIRDFLGLNSENVPIRNSSHGLEAGHAFFSPMLVKIDQELPGATKTTIHESGHEKYRQGLGGLTIEEKRAKVFTPLGEPRSHLVDEAMARFWENHIGRSREFSELIASEVKDHFDLEHGEDDIADAFHSWLNSYKSGNLNRLNSDEITYHSHIMTRFDIERDLINGDIEVEELPLEWKRKSEKYLGAEPDLEEAKGTEKGVLQDPHWFRGKFGYFPQYTLGTLLSAQLYESASEELDGLEEDLENGDYERLNQWLDENVHRHGKFYETDRLIQEATGSELSIEPFIEYIEEKFGE